MRERGCFKRKIVDNRKKIKKKKIRKKIHKKKYIINKKKNQLYLPCDSLFCFNLFNNLVSFNKSARKLFILYFFNCVSLFFIIRFYLNLLENAVLRCFFFPCHRQLMWGTTPMFKARKET